MCLRIVWINILLILFLCSCEETKVSVIIGEYHAKLDGKTSVLCLNKDGSHRQILINGKDTLNKIGGRWSVEYEYGEPRMRLVPFIIYRPSKGFKEFGSGLLNIGDKYLVEGVDNFLAYELIAENKCSITDVRP